MRLQLIYFFRRHGDYTDYLEKEFPVMDIWDNMISSLRLFEHVATGNGDPGLSSPAPAFFEEIHNGNGKGNGLEGFIDFFKNSDLKNKKGMIKNDILNLDLHFFMSDSFDVFNISLKSLDMIRHYFLYLGYFDGTSFMDQVRHVRNIGKEVAGDINVQTIEQLFELFSYGCESLIAQVKFLLELLGEEKKASKISLKFIKDIELPSEIKEPERESLRELLEVVDKENSYYLYHLGIPGGTIGKEIRLEGRNIDQFEDSETRAS